ncbi:MAG: glycosyltransferase family 39 protein [Gammaproteobacteria bacterium]|nr:glycosyltransferase family 39 protein [Gammaproteobacteria bacterium]
MTQPNVSSPLSTASSGNHAPEPQSLMALFGGLSRAMKGLVLAFIALKVLLIASVPLTGDEAYFIVWGQSLALGYYDHPPAVGWLLYFLSGLGDHLLVYRGFALIAAGVISYLLYKIVRLHAAIPQTTAFYVALAFFVSPISLMFIVTANDTVLVFFSVLGFYFYAKTLAQPTLFSAVLAGLFLGMAFLSKYFAVFMLIGLFIYSFVYYRQYAWRWMGLMVAIVLLFVAENLYFNATHCWNNILFNFFSRTTESAFELGNVVGYVLMILALVSPLGVYYLFKLRVIFSLGDSIKPLAPVLKQVLFATLPLLLVLLLVSTTNPVGLHWPLLAVTLLYALYALLSQTQLRTLFYFNVYSSLLIGVVIMGALIFVEDIISPSQKHHVAVYTQPELVCKQLPKTTFFTLGYSSQSALSYHCKNDDVHVFMSVSKFGREDDKKTDFKAMSGKDLTIFVTHSKEIPEVQRFFQQTEVKPLVINEETTYYLVEGQGFDYEQYRAEILTPVNQKFYTAPDWFPKLTDLFSSEPCDFKARYGFVD